MTLCKGCLIISRLCNSISSITLQNDGPEWQRPKREARGRILQEVARARARGRRTEEERGGAIRESGIEEVRAPDNRARVKARAYRWWPWSKKAARAFEKFGSWMMGLT